MRETIWHLWAMNTPADKFDLTRKGIMILPWDEEDQPRKVFTAAELEEIRVRFEKATRRRGEGEKG